MNTDGGREGRNADDPNPLGRLGERIAAAREAQSPKRGRAGEEYKAGSLAWRMVTELVAGVLVGGAIGWGLDGLFGTLPVFLILFGILGLIAGIKVMIRSAKEIEARAAEERQAGNGSGGSG
ncbi:hypothetical protein LNKW23_46850 [Paralimibaculum aggregatum]|uniref:ATP synthase protein I n=1 Tax=Paralimibaculum aggregatum TaxID=3036245 RepID=A0ABQ6LTQ1_9RHOB|nr:AtpZ/AtpI family protein [Limibaculum sp. NKW23]GMG85464.1 hypothetical protein LNKW23_46850 [Limibaculum sp. NKW23]